MFHQKHVTYVISILGIAGILVVFQYGYKNRQILFPIQINNKNVTIYPIILAETNDLLKSIEKCPECFLFLIKSDNSSSQQIFDVLNKIPSSTKAIFYPLTMKLIYNQPIPFYTILTNNRTETMIKMKYYWIDLIDKYRKLSKTSLLFFIYQSLKKPIPIMNYSWPNKTKLILYYTKFFGNSYWYNSNENDVYLNDLNPNNCPILVNACHITVDHKFFPASDASLIHIRESNNYNKLHSLKRRSDQKFVFFLKESPMHSPILSTNEHGDIFNYSQTYRPDSDVTGTTLKDFFWLFSYKINPDYNFESIVKSKQDGKILVAIISNCGGSSNRLAYINELKKYINVDVYGSCGTRCPVKSDCRQYVYSLYKFYLAFENSLCDEYVTEKFFLTIQSAKIIPVVLGWARYDHYLPMNSYIDVRNFSSPRQLANYIDYLDKNETAYLEYFQWRQHALHIKIPRYICELCLKLFLDDTNRKEQKLEKIDQFWNRKTQCHSYVKDVNNLWKMQ